MSKSTIVEGFKTPNLCEWQARGTACGIHDHDHDHCLLSTANIQSDFDQLQFL